MGARQAQRSGIRNESWQATEVRRVERRQIPWRAHDPLPRPYIWHRHITLPARKREDEIPDRMEETEDYQPRNILEENHQGQGGLSRTIYIYKGDGGSDDKK